MYTAIDYGLWTISYTHSPLPAHFVLLFVERQHRFADGVDQLFVGGIVGFCRHEGAVAVAEDEALAHLAHQVVRLEEAPEEAMIAAAADHHLSFVALVVVGKLKRGHCVEVWQAPGAPVVLTPIRYNNPGEFHRLRLWCIVVRA